MASKLEHIAFIMDGNGRWASMQGQRRTLGHEKGAEAIRAITAYCAKHPTIKTATFYAFSTENWKRPKEEVAFLMKLLSRYIQKEINTLIKHDIAFKVIGDTSAFSDELQANLQQAQEVTQEGKALTQILALNYGGRLEITQAVNSLLKKGHTEVTREMISEALQTPYVDLDMLVRTGGEMRLSNFLLWQSAYTELFFTPTLWPDFDEEELSLMIDQFHNRERRFGAIGRY